MRSAGAAVHRTIVVVDVEGFGDLRRTNPHKVAVRDGLYEALACRFRLTWDDPERHEP
jgi:hypothetical protein